MSDTIRWGILGTGAIAHQFAEGLSVLPDAKLMAVGSRTQHSADKFATTFAIPRRHPSYEALANDPEIDAIYIATPHPFHAENTIQCLKAGKAVLCEKPFALNATQSTEMIRVAREQSRFLMEAMWTRFQPVATQVRQWLQDGAIGDLRMIMADFGFRANFDPKSRLFDPELGGGALLDVGIYPISYAFMVLGEPEHVTSTAEIGSTGVDEQNAVLFRYAKGEIAILSSAARTVTPNTATIIGTTGTIHVHSPFWMAQSATLSRNDKDDHTINLPFLGNGYEYQAIAVMEALRSGKMESNIMPLDESQRIMETLDKIRAQWNMKYPGE